MDSGGFLIGWALGGGFFGRLGDLLGRSRALSLTVLTYAVFTGLSFLPSTRPRCTMSRTYPLAAVGDSGFGREGTDIDIDTLTEWKWVTIQLPPAGAQ